MVTSLIKPMNNTEQHIKQAINFFVKKWGWVLNFNYSLCFV